MKPASTSKTEPLRVAVVGCGQIADAHLQEIRRVPGARLVAVCDRLRDLAQRAADVFEVEGVFDDLGTMLAQARPDVVHVCTPAGSHAAIAEQCLAAGCHVYVEKPFTVDAAEARGVLDAARRHGRLVCVGHNELFDDIWLEVEDRARRGALGEVVHVESTQGYDLSGQFGSVLVADPNHWVRRLPGGFFHNTISHPVYKITQFLTDDEPEVWATWFAPHPTGQFPTELRVILRGAKVSANLVVSSAARPVQRVVKVCGTKESCEVDLEGRTLRRLRAATVRGPFIPLQAPWRQIGEATRRLGYELAEFLRGRIHYFRGMRRLFARFYEAAASGGAPPIAYGEIERVTAILDTIFAVADGQLPQGSPARRPAAQAEPSSRSAPPPVAARG